MKAAQQHLTYKRHDGAIGVGYFIPWAGRYVHSVAWPDLPAERYSVERLERMGVQVLGIETVGKEPPEPSPFTTEREDAARVSTEEAENSRTISGEKTENNPTISAKTSHNFSENIGQLENKFRTTFGETSDNLDPGFVQKPDNLGPNAEQTSDNLPAKIGQLEDNLRRTSGETSDNTESIAEPVSEAEAIRRFLQSSPESSNKEVVAALKERGIEVSSSQVSRERRRG